MKNCNYKNRLLRALQHNGVDTIEKLLRCIARRAASDRDADGALLPIIGIIEPPGCQCSHCEHYTVYRFCKCAEERIPGRCKKNTDYIDGVYKRMGMVYSEGREAYVACVKEIPEKYKTGYIGGRLREKIFLQGALDERDGFGIRDMRTWKVDTAPGKAEK